MNRIAVLLACHNRKDKTISALHALYQAYEEIKDKMELAVYLTDDGSRDGTSEAVGKKFSEVKILQGNGKLYWAGGMINSWVAARKGNYDGYLLLNDDTNVFPNLFKRLIETHHFCIGKYKKAGVYVGSTKDGITNELTYGGSIITNKFLATTKRLNPDKEPQECELGNANVMLVHQNVMEEIGILSDKYIHGLADYDYTLKAKRNNIPVLITPEYLGICTNDHKNPYDTFASISIQERIDTLYNPLILDFKSQLVYNRRHFPFRLPFVFLAGWLKILFPKFYINRSFNKRAV